MVDDAGTRLRNVSPLGDVEVPDLGLVVEFHHEIVVTDDALAARLVEGGHFTAVAKPGPKPTVDDGSGGATAVTPPPAPDGQPQTTDDVQPITPGAPA